MIQRTTQTFPAQTGSVITLPKRKQSWRVVTVTLNLTASVAGGTRAAQLVVTDGVSAVIGIWTGATTFGPTQGLQACFSSMGGNSGSLTISFDGVAIPADLWIQPQWNVTVGIANIQAADTVGTCVVQIEQFALAEKKGVAAKDQGSQDAPA